MTAKREPARKRGTEVGQSTVEFALTLILLMGFVLFFVQLSLTLAYGNYVHYATFMAARAYLGASADEADQEQRARDVLSRMLKRQGVDRFPSIAVGVGGEGGLKGAEIKRPARYSEGDPDYSWLQGVRYTFRSRLFVLPFGGGGIGSESRANSVNLSSESWLGREETWEECDQEMKTKGGYYDNGC